MSLSRESAIRSTHSKFCSLSTEPQPACMAVFDAGFHHRSAHKRPKALQTQHSRLVLRDPLSQETPNPALLPRAASNSASRSSARAMQLEGVPPSHLSRPVCHVPQSTSACAWTTKAACLERSSARKPFVSCSSTAPPPEARRELWGPSRGRLGPAARAAAPAASKSAHRQLPSASYAPGACQCFQERTSAAAICQLRARCRSVLGGGGARQHGWRQAS